MTDTNTTRKQNPPTHYQHYNAVMVPMGQPADIVHDVTLDADGNLHHQTLWGRTGDDERVVGFGPSRFEAIISGTDQRPARPVDFRL
jgi:hypothetical protein